MQSFKRNNCLRVSNHFVESYFASLQYDGVGLKPALEYCRHFHACIGLISGPSTYEDIKQMLEIDEEERKNHIQNLGFATEALEFLGESLDSRIAVPLGHFLIDNKGTADELSVLLHAALATAGSCDSCLQDTESDEDVNEDMEICHHSCYSCQKEKSLCSTCQERGLAAEQWNPLLRPCERCLVHERLCVRAVWIYLVSDCLEKQKTVLNRLQEEIQNSEDRLFSGLVHPDTGEILTWSAPDDPHTDKNIVAAYNNYLMLGKGQIVSSRTIHVLRDHPNPCQERGLAAEQWNPLLRPCERCLVHERLCVRAVWIYLVSDCLEKQKTVLNRLQEEIQNSEDRLFSGLVHPDTGEILTWSAPDDPHTDKNIVAAYDNYLMLRKGQIVSSRTIHVLRDHPNPEILASIQESNHKGVITKD